MGVLEHFPMKRHRFPHQTRCPPSPGGGGSTAERSEGRRGGVSFPYLHKRSPHPARFARDPPPPGEGEERARLTPRIPYRRNIHQTTFSRRNRAIVSSSSPSSAFRISSVCCPS